MQGHVRFEQVDFSYDGKTQVLHGVTFEAERGKVVALVGPSGAGKTTIANVIPRFFDVQGGRITIDGWDIRHVQLKSWREQIGIVLQEPILFSTTIRENIAYGRLKMGKQPGRGQADHCRNDQPILALILEPLAQ